MTDHPLASNDPRVWPELPLDAWADTYATLHLWTQVVGKIRMALAPPMNHWWHVALYCGARGLTTSRIPYDERSFCIDFDFVDHALRISCQDGAVEALALAPMTVADFHAETMAALGRLGIQVRIDTTPQELADRTPFEADTHHRSYDAPMVERFWTVLRHADWVLKESHWQFVGKTSPVHFFWGAFDLAVTRFNGRVNPSPPADPVMGEGYSHEVISHGFWPGGDWPLGGRMDGPAFYAYAVPEPAGFRGASVRPDGAAWSDALGEFLLPYDVMRRAPDPRRALLDFVRTTYEAGAEAAGWDRAALER